MPPTNRDFPFTGPTDANGNPTTYDPAWQRFTNLTPNQQAWFRSQPQWLTTYAGIKRWQKEIAGVTVSGVSVDTTADSLGLLAGFGLRAQRDQTGNPSATYAFTSRGAAVSLNVTQALGMFDAVSGFIQAARAVEKNMLDGINAKSVTSEAQIDSALAAVPTSF